MATLTLEEYLPKLRARRDKYRAMRDHGGCSGDGATFWNGKYHEADRTVRDLEAIILAKSQVAEGEAQ